MLTSYANRFRVAGENKHFSTLEFPIGWTKNQWPALIIDFELNRYRTEGISF